MINDRVVQLVGRASIDSELQLGNDYDILTTANCYRKETVDNQDGTVNVVFKLKPSGSFDIINDKGQKKNLKMKGSLSQKLRFRIEAVDDYETVMCKVLDNFEAFYQFTRTL